MLDRLTVPIVQAPMAGGPSTAALAAAVSNAGALGFMAGAIKAPDALARDLAELRRLTGRPFGVNLFMPSPAPADPAEVEAYAASLAGETQRAGVELGTPRSDDDGFADKLALLVAEPVAAVSFTFGCPDRETIAALQAAGSAVWVTVTSAADAREAAAAGADALVVQGTEAGGHQSSFVDGATPQDMGLLALLQVVGAAVDLPLVAAGGIATGRAVAAVLAGGAAAAQIGTAFMLCPEAATAEIHRAALAEPSPTALTRAFSGRLARGVVNRFMVEHGPAAPHAYPEIHHLTAPLRAKGRETGDAEVINLWAGQAHELARAAPAAEIVRDLADEARAALAEARERLG